MTHFGFDLVQGIYILTLLMGLALMVWGFQRFNAGPFKNIIYWIVASLALMTFHHLVFFVAPFYPGMLESYYSELADQIIVIFSGICNTYAGYLLIKFSRVHGFARR